MLHASISDGDECMDGTGEGCARVRVCVLLLLCFFFFFCNMSSNSESSSRSGGFLGHVGVRPPGFD